MFLVFIVVYKREFLSNNMLTMPKMTMQTMGQKQMGRSETGMNEAIGASLSAVDDGYCGVVKCCWVVGTKRHCCC